MRGIKLFVVDESYLAVVVVVVIVVVKDHWNFP